MKPWIGVDLDGTLAEYTGGRGDTTIGKPIQKMVDRVRYWMNVDKIEVRIFTARVAGSDRAANKKVIQDWLENECNLPRLEVTCVKDYGMVELYDDRAVQVIFNTGELVGHSTMEHRQILKDKEE
jgi:hypothetical protein